MWVVKAGGKSLFQGTKGKKKITVSNSSFPSAGSVQTVASLFRGDDDSRKVSCVEVPNKLCHLEFVFGLFKKKKKKGKTKSIAMSNKTAFWLRKHPERKGRNGNENVPTKCQQASV